MKIDTLVFNAQQWQSKLKEIEQPHAAQIIFLFGDSDAIKHAEHFEQLSAHYPNANIVGASTSGNILGEEISHHTIVATVLYFESARLEVHSISADGDDVRALSETLIGQFSPAGLKHIFIMSDGLNVNGSELVGGFNRLDKSCTISGGMAGDGSRFQETWVIENGQPSQKKIVAVGFYGDSLTVSTGSFAGWSAFGADRLVTRSEGNVLFELDGQPALDLYKQYLGEFAADLPYSGMRFPLNIRENDDSEEVIRTLLAIDEEQKSITFAGDIPIGYTARLMKPDIDVLIDGAGQAARDAVMKHDQRGVALLVSCVGRRAVMQDIIEEELEETAQILGENVLQTGFYSYGEIAPSRKFSNRCDLHNQTMTLTAIYEAS